MELDQYAIKWNVGKIGDMSDEQENPDLQYNDATF